MKKGAEMDKDGGEGDGVDKLPEEVWQEVLRWLPLPDLYAAARACRSWATLSLYDETFWRQLVERSTLPPPPLFNLFVKLRLSLASQVSQSAERTW